MTPKLYMPDRVPTRDEYRRGLQALETRLTGLERNLLAQQYAFDDHRCFAKELAARVGVSSWATVNARYASAAKKFCDASGFVPELRDDYSQRWWSVWSFGFGHGRGRFSWQMHPDLALTLEDLGWVTTSDSPPSLFAEEIPSTTRFVEGAMKRVVVNAYERDRRARDACIAALGAHCEVCGFDFSVVYGEIGTNYIHVHHHKPLAETVSAHAVDPVKDLVPVCPNCHAMLHRRQPPFTIEELRSTMARKSDPK